MSFKEEYKTSLKMIETEEVLDILIFRPLAYFVMKIFYYTPATPNFLSTISMLMGIASGVLFAFNDQSFLYLGIIALFGANVFDCSDGMLARAKKNGTKFGRIFDGMIDYITYIAVYFGIAYHLFTTSANIYFWPLESGHYLWWPLVVIAGAFTSIQAMMVDGARNDFTNYTKGSDIDFINKEMAEYQKGYEEIKSKRGKLREKLMYFMYFQYMKVQLKTASSIADKVDPKEYYKKNKLIMRLWSFAGSTSHLTFVMICALFNRFDIYVWGIIIPYNIYALILAVIQKKINKKNVN
jgi:phosphatidylglycerophosphate synthase